MPAWLAITVAVVTILFGGGILTLLFRLSYRVGRFEERTISKFESLEVSRGEIREQIAATLSALKSHAEDKSVHMNDKLEQLKYDTLKHNLEEVKSGVNELSKEIARRVEDLGKP